MKKSQPEEGSAPAAANVGGCRRNEFFNKTIKIISKKRKVLLQVLLMWEDANATSFFRPYLDMLPQSFDTPLFWTRDQVLITFPPLHFTTRGSPLYHLCDFPFHIHITPTLSCFDTPLFWSLSHVTRS